MRDHHSASSVNLVRRCARAAAYKYLDGLDDPEVSWDDVCAGVACTSSQRSRALGKAVHAHLEAWYRGERVDWTSLPGQIALSGAHLVPAPEDAGDHAVEHEFRVQRGGVEWLGYIDLWLRDRNLIVDYKTTSSIARWALTAEELAVDLQAALYVVATGCENVRWLYLQTGKQRKSFAVEARIPIAEAQRIVAAAASDARAFDFYERSEDAPQNPSACGMYGGCSYHFSRGGPCVVQSLPSAFTTEQKRRALMPLTIDKINALKEAADEAIGPEENPEPAAEPPANTGAVKRGRKKKTTAKLTATPPADEPIGEDEAEAEDEGVSGAPEPAQSASAPAKRGRKKAARKPTAPSDGSAGSQIVALQDELRAACGAVVEAEQARDALIARIGELCGS